MSRNFGLPAKCPPQNRLFQLPQIPGGLGLQGLDLWCLPAEEAGPKPAGEEEADGDAED